MGGFQAAMTKMAAAGKLALEGLAIGTAAVGFESVKMAMNFDQAMEMIHTQAGASQSEVDGLKDKVLALSGAVGIGPEKLAEGLYHIESSGLRGAQALDVLEQSAHLAKIGMADLDDVTYAMSGVMSVGMKDVQNATDAIAFMNSTVGMGDMRMQQLAAAIGTGILPSFKSAGLGMADFSAALATIADNSTPADEAATRLRMTISMMAAPSHPAIAALSRIGLEATSLATDLRQPNGLLVAMEDLKKHLEDSGLSAVEQTQVLEQAFGGGKTSGSILTMLEEIDKLRSKYDQLGTSQSRVTGVQQAWADQQTQFKQKWDDLIATLEAAGVKLGNYLIPKIMDAVDWTKKHKEQAEILAGVIGGVLAVAIAAYTVNMIAAAAANVAATWEFLVIAAAIAFLVYEIIKLNDWLNQVHMTWGTFFKDTAIVVYDWFYNKVGPIFNKVMDFFSWLDKHIGGTGNVPHLAPPPLPDLGGAVTGSTGGSTNSAGMFPHFAAGGVVPGPIGAPMLAVVHGGETVTPPGGGGGGDQVIHAHIHLDSREIWQGQLRLARRKGVTGPAALYPATAKAI